jgi:anti-anti-sigma regulatory factor
MPFEMTVDDERKILRIHLRGSVDLDERRVIHREMVRLCRQESLRNILVDVRDLDVATSTIDLYDFGTAVQETELPAG